MALPTTNLSLNAIHVEVGGTSGTQVSLNDADVRGIGNPNATYAGSDGINTTSGSQISIGEFRGATDSWSATLTTGNFTGQFCSKTCSYWSGYGYVLHETYTNSGTTYMRAVPQNDFSWTSSSTEGSITDTTFDPISNSKILGLYWDPTVLSNNSLFFSLAGHHANSGFTTITIGSASFSRSSATHTQDYQDYLISGTTYPYTYWQWTNVSNPFGTTEGATRSLTIS